MTDTVQQLNVELGARSYPILIGAGLIGNQDLTSWIAGDRVMIVTNETIAPLYLEKTRQNFPGCQIDEVILPDGETHKNWQTLNLIFDALLEKVHSRKTTLVALGGGVIGDMTGFAAACYQRGVDFIQIPTTLLAQVDSSVGARPVSITLWARIWWGPFISPAVCSLTPIPCKLCRRERFLPGSRK